MDVDRAETPGREEFDERSLVAAMLGGDERAMEAFADGYFPGLYRFALSRLHGDSELAREMVQTTVVKALSKLAGFRGEAPLFTWLCACCRNEIGMHFRRRGRTPRAVGLEAVDEPAGAPAPEPDQFPDGRLAKKEEALLVHAALDLLPAHYARALEWKYIERLPVDEIAARLSLGPKAAESLLGRARRAFREGYERLVAGGGPPRPVPCGASGGVR